MTRDRARFERREPSTLVFPGADSTVTVTVITSRIVRVAFVPPGPTAGSSYLVDREGAPAPFDVVDGEPLRLLTTDIGLGHARALGRGRVRHDRNQPHLLHEPSPMR